MRRLRNGIPLVLFFWGLTSSFPLWGENVLAYPRFSWSTWTAFTAGEVREIVYDDSSSNSILSELYWPVVPSLGFGAGEKITWLDWLDTQIQAEVYLPLDTGTMTDKDFNLVGSSYPYPVTNVVSKTNATLLSHYRFEISAGFPFLWEDWGFRPSIGFGYKEFFWESAGPSTQIETNAQDSGESTSQPIPSGLAISYRFQEILPLIGFGVERSFGDLESSLTLKASPFPFYADKDLHNLTSKTYQDYPMGGLWLNPSLVLGWNFGMGILSVSFDYELSRFARGNDYALDTYNAGSTTLYSNAAGSESDLWTIKLSWSSP